MRNTNPPPVQKPGQPPPDVPQPANKTVSAPKPWDL
jgi:hypothetical protein